MHVRSRFEHLLINIIECIPDEFIMNIDIGHLIIIDFIVVNIINTIKIIQSTNSS